MIEVMLFNFDFYSSSLLSDKPIVFGFYFEIKFAEIFEKLFYSV